MARAYKMLATTDHQVGMHIAQSSPEATKHFRIATTYDENYRGPQKPGMGGKREIKFGNSYYEVGGAGAVEVGRGGTYQRVDADEVAFWPKKVDMETTMASLSEACSHGLFTPKTTPNGKRGWFYKTWKGSKDGLNDYGRVFLPWFTDLTLEIPCNYNEIRDTLTEEEANLVVRHNLNARQIAWRRRAKRRLGALMPQEYPENDEDCFLGSGTSYFASDVLARLRQAERKPRKITRYGDGELWVWEKKREGHPYALGVDVSLGLPDGDFAVIQVLNLKTGNQAAEYRGRIPPYMLAQLVQKLMLENYGTTRSPAFVAIERDGPGEATLTHLIHALKAPTATLYRHKNKTKRGAPTTINYGWITNDPNRRTLLSDLKCAIEGYEEEDGSRIEPTIRVNSSRWIDEAHNFVLNAMGRYEAAAGEFDDLVMGLGIAVQQLNQRRRMSF